MKRCAVLLLLASTLAAGLPAPVEAALVDFFLVPGSGLVEGPAGSTLGWGYAIANHDPDHDLLVYGIDTSPSALGTPDTSLFDFPYVPAGGSVTVGYAPGLSGLFTFTWNPGLPAGTTETGFVTLSADLLDPADFSTFATLSLESPAYTAGVTGAVPEPGSLLLLSGGLAALAAARRKR